MFRPKSGRFSNFSMGYRRGSVENPQTWARITPFRFNDGIDEFFGRSFGARPTPLIGRKQEAVLSFDEHVMETQQS